MTDRKDLIELMKWNSWANDRYREVLAQLTLKDLNIETRYGNLLDRIVHIFASFKMWYQRMSGQSPQQVITGGDFSHMGDLNRTWRENEELLMQYLYKLSDEDLDEFVKYTSLDGSVYRRKRRHIFLHLTAHPNYHRGQISSIFKSLELPDLPPTDMVVYFLDTGQADRTLNE